MRLLLRLALVVVLVLGLVWLWQHRGLERSSREARAKVGSAVRGAGKALADLDRKLDVDSIREEMKRTGRIVRRKTAQTFDRVAEATEDARTTAAIKAKLALDGELSALDISVDTTDGRVTLAGRVDSLDHVARAIRLALEHDGVHEVVSTLQVRSPDEGPQAKKVTLVL
jgi:osmotically-inducible protein OsmY